MRQQGDIVGGAHAREVQPAARRETLRECGDLGLGDGQSGGNTVGSLVDFFEHKVGIGPFINAVPIAPGDGHRDAWQRRRSTQRLNRVVVWAQCGIFTVIQKYGLTRVAGKGVDV